MARAEPGSFRDRDSRVVVSEGSVLRVLSPNGAADWDLLASSELLSRRTETGDLVDTQEVALEDLGPSEGLLPGGVTKVLEHRRIPFVSYPYEWSFSMLQDAAILELDLAIEAIGEGLMLKDATPYNVQFEGSKPVFIDIGSFEALPEGKPWVGYRQFCMLFLYPLLLQAYKDVPFQPWLRGSIDGIRPVDAASLFALRDWLRRGVFLHVALHARLDRRANKSGPGEAESRKARQVKPEAVKAHLASMRKLVSKLRWKTGETAWSGYRQANTYSDSDDQRKMAFVAEVAAIEKPGLTWDMGCNDGAYARIAAEHSGQVLAFDFDHATIESLYRSLRDEGNRKILPLVVDLADPSPKLGWRGLERKTLPKRGAPDLMFALALIHHVSITANIPIHDFLDWVQSLGSTLVIEFPKRDDPMVQALLANKEPGANADYELGNFERELESRFTVERREELPSGDRVLYLARPKAGASGNGQ